MAIKVLGLSGRIGAGKDTLCQFLIRNREELGLGVVRRFASADYVKEVSDTLFDTCRFSKNDLSTLTLFDLAPFRKDNHLVNTSDFCTHATSREVYQAFAEYMKLVDPRCWIRKTQRDIVRAQDEVKLAVITDIRFKEDIDYFKEIFGEQFKVVRLTKVMEKSNHVSENDLDKWDRFAQEHYDGFINNEFQELPETQNALVEILKDFGWADRIESPESLGLLW